LFNVKNDSKYDYYDLSCVEFQLDAVEGGKAVLTNGHTGHVPRAPGFFLFEAPPTGCGEIIF